MKSNFEHFYRNNFNLRRWAGVAATGGTRRAHHVSLLIPITSRGRAQYSLLSLVTTSCVRIGNLHTFHSETKELHNFSSQGPGVLTRVPTTLAFFNGVSEARSLCALLQDKWLSSTLNRVCHLKRLFLPKVKHYLRAAPTLKFYIGRMEEAFLLSEREVIFQQ